MHDRSFMQSKRWILLAIVGTATISHSVALLRKSAQADPTAVFPKHDKHSIQTTHLLPIPSPQSLPSEQRAGDGSNHGHSQGIDSDSVRTDTEKPVHRHIKAVVPFIGGEQELELQIVDDLLVFDGDIAVGEFNNITSEAYISDWALEARPSATEGRELAAVFHEGRKLWTNGIVRDILYIVMILCVFYRIAGMLTNLGNLGEALKPCICFTSASTSC